MKRRLHAMTLALVLLIAGSAGLAKAVETPLNVQIMALHPVFESTYVAIEIPLAEDQLVSGVMWYNNDDQTVFPRVLAAAAYDGIAPDLADALVIVQNVSGQEDGWSQLQFPQLVTSPTGRFYVIFQFPAFGEAEGRGAGPGIGYAEETANSGVYLSAEGQDWLKMISAQRLLVEPVYATAGDKSNGGTLMLPAPSEQDKDTQSDDVVRVTTLQRPYPNPFNPTVKFEFTLKEPGKVRLSIYDIRGHLIRDVVNEALPTGRYERTWQGEDRQGRQMASGVYFARMQADGQCWTHRMVLVK